MRFGSAGSRSCRAGSFTTAPMPTLRWKKKRLSRSENVADVDWPGASRVGAETTRRRTALVNPSRVVKTLAAGFRSALWLTRQTAPAEAPADSSRARQLQQVHDRDPALACAISAARSMMTFDETWRTDHRAVDTLTLMSSPGNSDCSLDWSVVMPGSTSRSNAARATRQT